MKDEKGVLLYVGKAKNLKNRVRSYFTGDKEIKTAVLVKKIRTVEFIVTENEYEALLLENNLIKKHVPKYNINLKDGKSYPVIRITAEAYPRIFRTRRIIQDGSVYFGPFPAVQTIDTYLDLIERIFPLRKCKGPLKKRDHPCLYHHIGRCSAPCAGKIGKEEYAAQVESIKKLLSGETESLVADLEGRMKAAAEKLEFEKAARLRDSVKAVKDLDRGQKIVDFDEESRDYVAWAARDQLCTFIVFQMRGGSLGGRDVFHTGLFTSEEEGLQQFLLQYYTDKGRLPKKIFLAEPADTAEIAEYFRRELGGSAEIFPASEKRDKAVINLVRENAEQDLRKRIHDRGNVPALEDLKALLRLKRLPLRIEGFDIAQLSGKHPVASMVSFLKGLPDRKNYRKFHIKTLKGGIDDYEAVREVVARRYTRVVNEGKDKPDLVLIDGGKGQVHAARDILDAVGLVETPVIGLAKKNEEIFLPGEKDPVRLPEGTQALRVLQAVRDEAHRFATTFNKKLREKTLDLGLFTQVPGIGKVKSGRILKHFGSVEAVAEAPGYEIAKAGGISLEVAENLKIRLSPGEKDS